MILRIYNKTSKDAYVCCGKVRPREDRRIGIVVKSNSRVELKLDINSFPKDDPFDLKRFWIRFDRGGAFRPLRKHCRIFGGPDSLATGEKFYKRAKRLYG